MVAASSTTRFRRPSKAIDFSQLQKREQVKALARLSELCHQGEPDSRTARANVGEDDTMNSLGDTGRDADDSSPPRQLRRRDRSNSSRSSSEPGVIDIEARVVGRSDDTQPDATQPELVRPQTAPPSPPPTQAGTVDMLSRRKVRRLRSTMGSPRTVGQHFDAVVFPTCAACSRMEGGYFGMLLFDWCHHGFCANGP